MKRALQCLLLSIAMSSLTAVCQAEPTKIDVGVNIYDPIGDLPFPRGPIELPDVYIDGSTLSFENLWDSYVLQIIQNGTIVYSTLVSSGTTSVILPSALSGDYEFRLVADSYYYYGYISL